MSEIVVVVPDPLDGEAVAPFAAGLAAALASAPDRLVVDLSGCSRIDAAAIGVLLQAHTAMLRGQGVLRLRGPGERIRRALRLARIDQVLAVEDPAVAR
jgi:anti-sigma B factor antagonist